jgi:hypothetical protein
MPALTIDLQSRTDRNGLVHCWMCGRILAASRRKGPSPTLLCGPRSKKGTCAYAYYLETVRVRMRDLRMRRAVLAGRLPGPPLRTELPAILAGRTA